ncbi:ribosomal protein S1 [Streptosporangium album]|uniref:Ribosomal protein S1 n=1 Tax=Streptosporangium album TaxID=47479 RepID=A0A7W7WAG9_9ACTN|nr:ribosomal protein S1 [Streptosporangium album]
MGEKARSDARRAFLCALQNGQVRKGVVSSVVDFGAFVELGGVDGLVSVPNLSWRRFDHPSEVVRVGQEITVTVLQVDVEREQVSLSLKALQPDPLQQFARTQLGRFLSGRVTKVAPIGVFVGVHEGVEGLVPLSEFTAHNIDDPEQVLQLGDEVVVQVVDINIDTRRVSFALQAGKGPIAT